MAPTDAPLALVDGLVPKFQADGSMQSGDSAMQTANEGKSSNAEAAQRASEPKDPWALGITKLKLTAQAKPISAATWNLDPPHKGYASFSITKAFGLS
ncbi:hypothetical protein PtA15_6A382 [Puccinia triticina]|uniref:Uncharacterized protein n=1 Tax=Puccinia triticina TaxID=208348 RepID=A0ABY7CN26_9BASI|nr:uncharacterized protein PtA15_6A382 [Puccinia triticina]WAQ85753.1 hypothetical protein PtA15_6A382 [Puccinia triticina]